MRATGCRWLSARFANCCHSARLQATWRQRKGSRTALLSTDSHPTDIPARGREPRNRIRSREEMPPLMTPSDYSSLCSPGWRAGQRKANQNEFAGSMAARARHGLLRAASARGMCLRQKHANRGLLRASQGHLRLGHRGHGAGLQTGGSSPRKGGRGSPKPHPQQEPPPSQALTEAAGAIHSSVVRAPHKEGHASQTRAGDTAACCPQGSPAMSVSVPPTPARPGRGEPENKPLGLRRAAPRGEPCAVLRESHQEQEDVCTPVQEDLNRATRCLATPGRLPIMASLPRALWLPIYLYSSVAKLHPNHLR